MAIAVLFLFVRKKTEYNKTAVKSGALTADFTALFLLFSLL